METDSEQAHLALAFEDLGASEKTALEAILARWMEHRAPGALDGIRPGTPPHEIRRVLEAIPLPQRISLAARAGSREREIMVHDPNASVIDALVKNPGITAGEICAVLAHSAIAPPTFETIANDARWGKNDGIRLALATHPRIPQPLFDRVLRDIPEAALRSWLHRPDLNLEIRKKIVKKLQR